MPSTIASGAVTLLAGDFAAFVMRDFAIQLGTFVEKYAESNQVGFRSMMLHSFGMQSEGSPIQRLIQP
jgi:hypothetical protein